MFAWRHHDIVLASLRWARGLSGPAVLRSASRLRQRTCPAPTSHSRRRRWLGKPGCDQYKERLKVFDCAVRLPFDGASQQCLSNFLTAVRDGGGYGALLPLDPALSEEFTTNLTEDRRGSPAAVEKRRKSSKKGLKFQPKIASKAARAQLRASMAKLRASKAKR
jgi:hypothetical protein